MELDIVLFDLAGDQSCSLINFCSCVKYQSPFATGAQ